MFENDRESNNPIPTREPDREPHHRGACLDDDAADSEGGDDS